MEGFQVTRDKLGLTLSSKRLSTVLVIALPLALVFTLLYQNSAFAIFGRFADFKGLGGRRAGESGHGQIVADEVLSSTTQNLTGKGQVQNSTDEVTLVGESHNSTDVALGGQAQNPTSDLVGNEAQNNTRETVGGRTLNVTEPYAGSSETDDSIGAVKNESLPLVTSTNVRDKLLGGLLSPSFDEASCLSRYQSYLLRKASPHKPPAYLINKLRNYEDLHGRCGPHTEAYSRTMRKLLQSESIRGSSTTTMCQYIVWTPANGLGNRMINIVSAFLYAVLTQRVMIVDFGEDMKGLFCEPFPNSTWLLPEDFPHKHRFDDLPNFDRLLQQKNSNSTKDSSPPFLLLNLEHGNHDENRVFHCDYAQQILQKSHVIILRSDQYFAPGLFMIPPFREELNKMFAEKEIIFHHIGRYLFHPSDETWGLISRFYQAYLAKADEIIGIQIRVFAKSSKIQYVMDRVLACVLSKKILPELEKGKLVTSPTRNQTLKAVLVTSLKPDYSETLRSMYSMKPTVTGDIVGVFQPSHEQEQKSFDSEHNMKAWAEMFLLSLSDVLVTSGVSTFGYVAQGLAGLKPWIMEKLDNSFKDPPCIQGISMEPCFHFPPKFNCITKEPPSSYGCSADTSFDIKSQFPFMKPCEDLCWGVKMIKDHE